MKIYIRSIADRLKINCIISIYIRSSPATTIQWSVQIAIVHMNAANTIDMVITNKTRRWNKYSSYNILRSSRSKPPSVEVDMLAYCCSCGCHFNCITIILNQKPITIYDLASCFVDWNQHRLDTFERFCFSCSFLMFV